MISSPNIMLSDQSKVGRNWGWVLTFGILLIITGLCAISAAIQTTILSVMFLGIVLAVAGVIEIIYAFSYWWHEWGMFFITLMLGILYAIFGLMLITHPVLGAASLTLLIATFFIVAGIFRIIASISPRLPNWGWALVNGIITLILGILIFVHWPASSLFIIGLFVGIELLISGLYLVMFSTALRQLEHVS